MITLSSHTCFIPSLVIHNNPQYFSCINLLQKRRRRSKLTLASIDLEQERKGKYETIQEYTLHIRALLSFVLGFMLKRVHILLQYLITFSMIQIHKKVKSRGENFSLFMRMKDSRVCVKSREVGVWWAKKGGRKNYVEHNSLSTISFFISKEFTMFVCSFNNHEILNQNIYFKSS